MIRPAVFLPLALSVAGCSLPTHVASKTIDLQLPIAGVQAIDCESHNGAITIIGDPMATTISLHAEIAVRAFSPSDASALLVQTSVDQNVVDGQLVVRCKHPEALGGRIVTFSCTLRVPPALGATLLSHNGMIDVRGIDGDLHVESHNGAIVAVSRAHRIDATTHNGEVTLRCDGEGDLDGSIESHNGAITIDLATGARTTVDASTHNGRLAWPADALDVRREDSTLSCRFGDGAGHLAIVTHNGDVNIRRGTKPAKN